MCTFCWGARHVPRLSSRYAITHFRHFFSRKSFTNSKQQRRALISLFTSMKEWMNKHWKQRATHQVWAVIGWPVTEGTGLQLFMSKQRLSHELYVYIWSSSQKLSFLSETVITKQHREVIESFVMWHCNNPPKLNTHNSKELVMDSCWMSITSWVHSKSFICAHMQGQRAGLETKKETEASCKSPTDPDSTEHLYTHSDWLIVSANNFLAFQLNNLETGNPAVTLRPYFLLLVKIKNNSFQANMQHPTVFLRRNPCWSIVHRAKQDYPLVLHCEIRRCSSNHAN